MTQARDETLLAALKQGMLTRRAVLRGAGASAAGMLLAACGTPGTAKAPSQQSATDLSTTEKIVNWSNWPLYIDVDEKTKRHPTIDQFQKQTGITVHYTEDVNDNDEFFGKVRNQLSAGQDTGRDLVVLTDWMAGRLIRLKWVEKFDHSQVPNLKNLQPALQNVSFDKGRNYSLPWQSGLGGIAYNPKLTGGPVTTVKQLLTDPRLKGKVTALTEMRDTVGLTMLDQGKDPSKFTDNDFNNAIEMLQKAVTDKQIRRFTGNDYAQDLSKGNIAAAIAWSGDIFQLQADNPNIKFVVPEAGATLWSDNMMIPNKARHKKNAEKIMNFYYEPQIAAELAASVNYICPVVGAQQAMEKIDKKLVNEPLIFPDEALLAKTHVFMGLNADQEKRYTAAFQKLTGA